MSAGQCLDVRVGYDERAREDLIAFLSEFISVHVACGSTFVDGAERGMWDGVKILRLHTDDATALRAFIEKEYRLGDDCEYEVHETQVDARRCMTYLPDYDSRYGYKKFDI